MVRGLSLGALVATLLAGAVAPAPTALGQAVARNPESAFAATVARLSEPGGFFDTDNLISNEGSYLHVIARLRELGVTGGVYIGVGPDQNFSYIAAIRPRYAYILDIRRDNLLQHLMFKALFERSKNRMDYLCRWLGRAPPADVVAWADRPVADMLDWLDAHPVNESFVAAEEEAMVRAARRTGIPLSDQDVGTMKRFHATFVKEGLGLRFTSFNRGPRPYYPTLRQLILERDLNGKQAGYLASESDWAFVKGLERADRLIPVVGNLAGAHSLPTIGREMAARGDKVAAIYTSNVEQYVWRDGSFPKFAESLADLPRDGRSVIIRSYFGGGYGGQQHPLARGSYYSTQLLQTIDDFAGRFKKGGWGSYWELVTLGAQ